MADTKVADTVSEQEFREAALAFLRAHAKPKVREETSWGEGSDEVAIFREESPEEQAAELEAWGFEMAVAPVPEFLKAGGACRCLTLALDVTLGPCPPPGA